jgi:hypothetical protein
MIRIYQNFTDQRKITSSFDPNVWCLRIVGVCAAEWRSPADDLNDQDRFFDGISSRKSPNVCYFVSGQLV